MKEKRSEENPKRSASGANVRSTRHGVAGSIGERHLGDMVCRVTLFSIIKRMAGGVARIYGKPVIS